VTATNFGLEDPDLLSDDFTYIEPLMGPMDKERYIAVFDEFNVKDAVPDLDYQFQVRMMFELSVILVSWCNTDHLGILFGLNRTTGLIHMIHTEFGLIREHVERELARLAKVLHLILPSTLRLRRVSVWLLTMTGFARASQLQLH
jgi:hypothetical protein